MDKQYLINGNEVTKSVFVNSLKNSLTTVIVDEDGKEYEKFDQQRYNELLATLNRGWTYTIFWPETKTLPRILREYKIKAKDEAIIEKLTGGKS